MKATDLVAIALVLVAIAGALLVFRADLAHDVRTGPRRMVEAAIPLVGLFALVWWLLANR